MSFFLAWKWLPKGSHASRHAFRDAGRNSNVHAPSQDLRRSENLIQMEHFPMVSVNVIQFPSIRFLSPVSEAREAQTFPDKKAPHIQSAL